MKLSKLAFLAALCSGAAISGGSAASTAWGQLPLATIDSGVAQVSYCDCAQPDCGCDTAITGNSNGACYDGCGSGSLFDAGCLGDCELGDPCSLFGECRGFTVGGWVQVGYHDSNLILFNSRKHEAQVHQAWVYAEKEIDTSQGFDIGGRIDYVYGTDGQDTQAFGIDNDHWDNQWDNGADYGHALPQVYLEAGYGDWSAIVGHFYTIIGYEVVPAPDNFFYSHAYTMYNSEPFTHTGALITYNVSEDIDFYGGYVLGWDSGFEDNGDAFLGGSSVQLTDDVNVTSTTTIGRFADNSGGNERGFLSSTVATVRLTEQLNYVFHTDYLDTEDANGNTVRDTFGINQYLFRTLSDCVALGARFEWWNVEADSRGFYDNADFDLSGDYDIYALTLGANLRPHANVVVRPEIRWDWVDGDRNRLALADFEILEDNDDQQTTFGIDAILLF